MLNNQSVGWCKTMTMADIALFRWDYEPATELASVVDLCR